MKLSQPTPELPVRDWRAAQDFYVAKMGFTPAWTLEDAQMTALAHGECAIFLRQVEGAITPCVHWIFVDDVDAAHRDLTALGADIQGPPVDEP